MLSRSVVGERLGTSATSPSCLREGQARGGDHQLYQKTMFLYPARARPGTIMHPPTDVKCVMLAIKQNTGPPEYTARSALLSHELVPRAELAQLLDLCEHTLRIWERCGQGRPPVRIGRRVFYRTETARRWLLDQERKPPTA